MRSHASGVSLGYRVGTFAIASATLLVVAAIIVLPLWWVLHK